MESVVTLAPVAIAPALDATTRREEAFEFTGDGYEYFRIWIVNLMLSVATLGIYSAWAKVRRMEYFYRHTRLAGVAFDYHGKPLAILEGRLVAAALFGGYYLAGYVSPQLGLAAFALLAAIMPWLLNRSLAFKLYNSSYRGLRFHFDGSNREAYWVLLVLPILTVLSAFTLAPLWHHRLKQYQHANAAFGRTPFSIDAPVGAFYRAYLITALSVTALLAFSVVWLAGAGALLGPSGGIAVTLVVYVLAGTAIVSLTTAQVQNIVWRHTSLGACRFSCTLEGHRLLMISLTNLLATICTLGLFRPFADVRLTRYVLGELTLVAGGSLDDFTAGERQHVAATGEEASEIFDIDLGI